MIRIAVDAMGGDYAPSAVVDGAVAAARYLAVPVALVGPTAPLEQALSTYPRWRQFGIEIIEAPDVVSMSDSPAAAVRRMPGASIRVAAELVVRQGAGALVSAGNTGATVIWPRMARLA